MSHPCLHRSSTTVGIYCHCSSIDRLMLLLSLLRFNHHGGETLWWMETWNRSVWAPSWASVDWPLQSEPLIFSEIVATTMLPVVFPKLPTYQRLISATPGVSPSSSASTGLSFQILPDHICVNVSSTSHQTLLRTTSCFPEIWWMVKAIVSDTLSSSHSSTLLWLDGSHFSPPPKSKLFLSHKLPVSVLSGDRFMLFEPLPRLPVCHRARPGFLLTSGLECVWGRQGWHALGVERMCLSNWEQNTARIRAPL